MSSDKLVFYSLAESSWYRTPQKHEPVPGRQISDRITSFNDEIFVACTFHIVQKSSVLDHSQSLDLSTECIDSPLTELINASCPCTNSQSILVLGMLFLELEKLINLVKKSLARTIKNTI